MSQIIRNIPKPRPAKIATIIQARMGSKRFPGKTMSILAGKPVLEWVVERAQLIQGPLAKYVGVIIAVPDLLQSDTLLLLADRMGVEHFLGPEDDVLKRYHDAAKFFNLDYIIRITADCPFIDPVVCTQVVQLLCWRKLDYASNIHPKRTYQKGLDCEAFTFDCLEAAHKLAETAYDKEHVTPWMQRTQGINRGNVVQRIDKSDVNWCVDYPKDIERLEKELMKAQTEIPIIKPKPSEELIKPEQKYERAN